MRDGAYGVTGRSTDDVYPAGRDDGEEVEGMIDRRRFVQFRLWHLIVTVAAFSVLFAYLAKQWRKPVFKWTDHYISFSHTVESRPGWDMRCVSISIQLPEADVHFLDFAPYGSLDHCSVSFVGNPRQHLDYEGPAVKWPSKPPIPATHERRFRELYTIYLKRVSAERRAYLEDPDGSGIDLATFPYEHVTIRLKRNWLEPREPDIDYEYWLTPPDRW
jgi:hypothetical protein